MGSELHQLLTIDDVCEIVKVSRHTVRGWLAAGSIPSLRAGQLVRFDPDEIQLWLRSQHESATSVTSASNVPDGGR